LPVSRRGSWPWRLTVLADRYRRWCLGGAFLLLLLGFNGQWRPETDSAVHATIARHLAEGRGFTHPNGDGGWANPGVPYLVATTFRLFGVDVMWPAVAIMLCFAAGTLALTYLWVGLHTRRGVAVIVTVMLAINSTFYRHALNVSADTPFLFGLMLSLVGYELMQRTDRRGVMGLVLIGLGMGLMAAFRIVSLVVGAALLITFLVEAIRRLEWRPLAAAALVLVVSIAVRALDRRASDSSGLFPKESQAVHYSEDRQGGTLHHAVRVQLPYLLSDVAPNALLGNQLYSQSIILDGLITVVMFSGAFMLIRRRWLWGLIVSLFLIQWLLYWSVPRYFLPIIPILIFGWWRFTRWVAWVAIPHRVAYRVAAFLFILYVGMNLGRTAGFVIEQRSLPFIVQYRGGDYEGIMELGRELRRLTPPGAWLLTPGKWRTILTFASDRRAASATLGSLPADQDPSTVYVLEPSDEPTRQMLKSRGWELSEPLCSFTRSSDRAPLTVHRVRTSTGAVP
jgi:hypothetical protein